MPIRYLPHTRFARANKKAGGGFNPQYENIYLAYLVTPSDADAEAQNAYVQVGVTDGWWGIGDRKHIFASHSGGRDANLNWFDPTNDAKLHTIVSAPVWTQYQGYQGNGINSHGDLQYDCSVDNVNFLLLDGCVTVYIRTEVTSTTKFDMGSVGTANKIELNTKRFGGAAALTGAINGGLKVGVGSIATASLGMYGIDKNITGFFDFYHKGLLLEAVASVETALSDGDIFTMCRNNGGVAISFSDRQISKIDVGASLTPAQHLSEKNAFQDLMTHYGTAV